MNETIQQDDQSTEVGPESTTQVEESQATTTEPENNADNTTKDSNDLEALLQQHDEAAKAAEEAATPEAPTAATEAPDTSEAQPTPDNSEPDSRMDVIWDDFQKNKVREANEDIHNAVETMKAAEPILAALPKYAVKGGLEELSREDPRIKTAFLRRHEDPTMWKDTLKELAKKMVSDMSAQPDGEASGNVESLRALVNGQQGVPVDTGPTPEERNKMTDSQWKQYVEDQYAE